MLPTKMTSRMEALAALAFCNPFGAERTALEARVLGRRAKRGANWNRSLDWSADDPVLSAIQQQAEQLLDELSRRVRDGYQLSDAENDLLRGVALYVLYYRYEQAFFDEINAERPLSMKQPYARFAKDYAELFELSGAPSWCSSPAELFALFFQTRRTFHFIFHRILGTSKAAAELRARVWESVLTVDPMRYLAQLRGRMHEVSTLITGPSGTGKELVASAIGSSGFIPFDPSSGRFHQDFRECFHPLHLAAVTKTLVESELFGHKKGAFTGASMDRPGHFEDKTASETVFLDEIGELDGELQVKLLRLLQSRSFQRLGENRGRTFGGKVVAATNRNLAEAMAQGRFREDLYYRLCADIVHTPSLNEQIDGDVDELGNLVTLITERFVGTRDEGLVDQMLAGIERDVGLAYAWPGNMRELEQCVRNLLIHGRYVPAEVPGSQPGPGLGLQGLFAEMRSAKADMDRVMGMYSTWVYAKKGSFEEAGETLGLDRRTVSKHVDRDLLDELE